MVRVSNGVPLDYIRPPSAELSSVRLTNSEILRAQHIKKKHELGTTPNYLAAQKNKKKVVNLVNGKPTGAAPAREKKVNITAARQKQQEIDNKYKNLKKYSYNKAYMV